MYTPEPCAGHCYVPDLLESLSGSQTPYFQCVNLKKSCTSDHAVLVKYCLTSDHVPLYLPSIALHQTKHFHTCQILPQTRH